MSGRVLVIGGGLAGLSAALHLGNEAVVLEGSRNVGGLCRSYRREGFTLDISGHLLHFRQPAIRRLVGSLLPRQLVRHRRQASIRFRRRLISYPFQAHLYQLTETIREECLTGFLDAPARKKKGRATEPDNFDDWLKHQFGDGIFRHFLEPYNRKMWQVPLSRLTSDWARWAVPVPSAEQIREAADPGRELRLGYNPVFYYPRHGGIGSLAQRMAESVFQLHLGDKVVEIDLHRRRAVTATGRRFFFDDLISTAPLPELLRMTKGLPPSMVGAAEKLEYVSVCIFNIGLARPPSGGQHWIYFPGRGVPFYRVGFAHNFSSTAAPPGCQSLYVEVSRKPGLTGGCMMLWEKVRKGLVSSGIMEKGEEPAVLDVLHVPYAYVLYDRYRAKVLPSLLGELAERGVFSIGRYGAWEYSTMEDALFQGRDAARKIRI